MTMLTCIDCGDQCERRSPTQLRCPACRAAKKKERARAGSDKAFAGARHIVQEWTATDAHAEEQALCRRALELERLPATPERLAEYEAICRKLTVKGAAV